MMAAVTGPIVKMTNAMCSHRMSRSVNDSDLAAAAADMDRDRSMKAILGPPPAVRPAPAPARARRLGAPAGADQPGQQQADRAGAEQQDGPGRVQAGGRGPAEPVLQQVPLEQVRQQVAGEPVHQAENHRYQAGDGQEVSQAPADGAHEVARPVAQARVPLHVSEDHYRRLPRGGPAAGQRRLNTLLSG